MHLLQTERDTGREGQTGRDRDRETDPARETKGEKEKEKRWIEREGRERENVDDRQTD